jgi:phosphoglycolate phosphatase-like HAD superfamily hydrolase
MNAVVFDMDGTLLRLQVDIEEVRLRLAALFAPRGVTAPFRPILRRIHEAAAEAGDPALARAGLAILDEAEARGAARAEAREGAGELIAALRARGVRLGLVTDNGRACVQPALAAAGLPAGAFEAIATRDDVPAPKPDPAGVVAVARALGGAAWYVGDHAKDVQAGRAAAALVPGLRVAFVRGGLGDAPPEGADLVADDLRGLLAAL